MKRLNISKKIRFEIFKRDCFKCQYCGKCAPDVILEVDHINPVAKGGKNDLLNLITACFDCNRGKSDNKLSDNSVIEIQRKQIEELQERRAQLDMMLEWKLSVVDSAKDDYLRVVDYWDRKIDYSLSDSGIETVKTLVKKYGAIKIIEAIDQSIEKYLYPNGNRNNIEFVFKKISTIARYNSKPKEEQEKSDRISQVLRIARNKYSTFDYQDACKAISRFMGVYDNVDRLDEITEECHKFSDWKSCLYA